MEEGRKVHAIEPFCYRCWVHLCLSGVLVRGEAEEEEVFKVFI